MVRWGCWDMMDGSDRSTAVAVSEKWDSGPLARDLDTTVSGLTELTLDLVLDTTEPFSIRPRGDTLISDLVDGVDERNTASMLFPSASRTAAL